MAQLKNQQSSIPGGFVFMEPSTGWQPAPFSSLDSITQQLIAHRRGRPDLIARNNWSLDPAVVIQEVIQYNVAKCQQMGWNDYLIDGGAVTVPFTPVPRRSSLQKAAAVAAGASTLVDWVSHGAEAVTPELSAKRAATCVACPLNKSGNWDSWFTQPVAQAIRMTVEKAKQMRLTTPSDEKLFVCEACGCPLPLKVHMPLSRIVAKMKPEQAEALHENCWIRRNDA